MLKVKKLIIICLLPILLSGCARAEGAMAPNGYIAPVACIFAACAYESGESDLAHKALDNAFADQISYPLAVLLRRVFFSGWPAQSFAAMRAQLHPKICAALFLG
jgi:hypothetical protein